MNLTASPIQMQLPIFVTAYKQNNNKDVKKLREYTANVCRDLRGVYGEIRVRGFQIYRVCMLPTIPAIFFKEKQ